MSILATRLSIPKLTQSFQIKQVVSLLGEGISSALGNKVIFLDKIGKVSTFLQGVVDVGDALSEVSDQRNFFQCPSANQQTSCIQSPRQFLVSSIRYSRYLTYFVFPILC